MGMYYEEGQIGSILKSLPLFQTQSSYVVSVAIGLFFFGLHPGLRILLAKCSTSCLSDVVHKSSFVFRFKRVQATTDLVAV